MYTRITMYHYNVETEKIIQTIILKSFTCVHKPLKLKNGLNNELKMHIMLGQNDLIQYKIQTILQHEINCKISCKCKK